MKDNHENDIDRDFDDTYNNFFENEHFTPFKDEERPDQIIDNDSHGPHETRPDACDSLDEEIPSRKKSRGFYVTLGICLLGIAATALITYNGVSDYISPENNVEPIATTAENPTLPKNQQAGASLSGILDDREDETEDEDSDDVISRATEAVTTTEADDSGTEDNTEVLDLIRPAGSEVINPFSGTVPVYSEVFQDWRTHNGTDYLLAEGENVCMMFSGTISDIIDDEMLGSVITVEHDNNIVAKYCGVVPDDDIEPGVYLNAGDVLGTIGIIPGESNLESHLHLEVKQGGEYIDAESLFEELDDADDVSYGGEDEGVVLYDGVVD